MEIDQINEVFGWNLPEGDYETLAGFLLAHFQRVPKTTERFRYRDLAFIVHSASPRAILEVIVEKIPPENRGN
jgi:CBS domain containing-hemolysin-like protein